jgi:hypothetical protein
LKLAFNKTHRGLKNTSIKELDKKIEEVVSEQAISEKTSEKSIESSPAINVEPH